MKGRLVVLVAVAVALVGPGAALGSKSRASTVAPTAFQRAAIIKAFGDPSSASPCLIVRLAAASEREYGTVRFRLRTSCSRWAFNGVNVLRRVRPRHWKVVFEGSAYRCPVPRIPRQVQRDLGVCR